MKTLYIKNMVCNRCIQAVGEELRKIGLHPERITLGEVALAEDELSKEKWAEVDLVLRERGFERIDDRKSRVIESIKNLVIQRVHQPVRQARKLNWSTILSEALHLEYNHLSSLFSSVEGITLEQFIIHQKVERAKELLFYDELTLTQIADQLGYSSVAHLSAQFKRITGQTPTELKKSREATQNRKPLDHVV